MYVHVNVYPVAGFEFVLIVQVCTGTRCIIKLKTVLALASCILH